MKRKILKYLFEMLTCRHCSLLIVISILSLFVFYHASAQGYVIENYHVDLTLNKNSSVKVVEKIRVKFTEKRRGIIRAIPFRYLFVPDYSKPEMAIRSQSGPYYHTLIKDIKVKDHNFIVYDEGDFHMIRIGDPEIYLKGQVEYIIEYTVWGAMNAFKSVVEFPFNVIGTDWDAPILESSFEIHMYTNHTINREDVAVYTGHLGSKESDVIITSDPGKISGKTTRKLNPYEGMTVSLLLPKTLFPDTNIPLEAYAENYLIENHSLKGFVNNDASVDIEEHYTLHITNVNNIGFLQKIFQHHLLNQSEPQRYYLQDIVVVDTDLNKNLFFSYQRESYEDIIRINLDKSSVRKKINLKITYKLWGAFVEDSVSLNTRILLPLTLLDGKEPVKSSNLTLSINSADKAVLNSFNQSLKSSGSYIAKNNKYKSVGHTLNRESKTGIDIGLNYYLAYASINFDKIPYGVFAKDFIVKSNRHYFDLNSDGSVLVKHHVQIETFNPEYRSRFIWRIPYRFRALSDENGKQLRWPLWNPFSAYSDIKIDDILIDTSLFYIESIEKDYYLIKWKKEAAPQAYFETSLSYRLSGNLFKTDNNFIFNYPLSAHFDEPSIFTTFNFTSPDSLNSEPTYRFWKFEENSGLKDISSEFDNQALYSRILPWQVVFLSASIPGDTIRIPLSQKSGLIVSNNYYLLLAIFIFFIIFILWMLFGKDKKPILNVRYYPPPGLTPAELGWLYDDHIHRRDLISLIYYWGAKGFLNIEEIAGRKGRITDYKLVRLAPLDKDSKPFEKIFFNGLFSGNGNEVRVSRLEDKFYTTLNKSKKSLEQYAGKNSFYIPGTRGFGRLMTSFGLIAFIVSGLMIFYGIDADDYSPTVSFFIISISLFIFGKKMPKKDIYGFKMYQEIIGFKEFMKRAESDRLKSLLEENPAYFEKTLPYAIAFGMADNWSEKFEAFITKPPSWYKSSGSLKSFSTSNFAHSIDRSMNSISSSLSSRPSSSSSGSGFSGGSSGGGFGGGGGRSW